MSVKYKFGNPDGLYFISFATIGWIDVFTRREYKDLLVESLQHCQDKKGLELFAWCIMSNHVHLIARAAEGHSLSGIMRDFKKFTSKQLIKMIEENQQESRREWMLGIFRRAGESNSNNKEYQFWRQDNRPIELQTPEMMQQRLDYLHRNPVEAGWVDNPEDYPYSSARDFAGGKGLLKLMEW